MPYQVIALIESPLGVLTVTESVQEINAVAVMWGAEDLIAERGGTASRRADGTYRDVACHLRSTGLLAAKAYGRLAIDGVFLDIANLDGLRAECDDAIAVGFDVKVAIHPRQVTVIREAFAPTEDEMDWARRVLAAAEKERAEYSASREKWWMPRCSAMQSRSCAEPLSSNASEIKHR
jgi:citrate lyase subunit beta / citryl-CoA lyase